jgi:hypothetical protein
VTRSTSIHDKIEVADLRSDLADATCCFSFVSSGLMNGKSRPIGLSAHQLSHGHFSASDG